MTGGLEPPGNPTGERAPAPALGVMRGERGKEERTPVTKRPYQQVGVSRVTTRQTFGNETIKANLPGAGDLLRILQSRSGVLPFAGLACEGVL